MKTLLDLLDFAAFMVLATIRGAWEKITGRKATDTRAFGCLFVLGYGFIVLFIVVAIAIPLVYAAAWVWGAIFGVAPYR